MSKTKIALILSSMLLSVSSFAQQKAEDSLSVTLNSKQPTGSLPYQSLKSDKNMGDFNDKLWKELYQAIVKGASAVDQNLAENGQDIQSCSLHRIKSFHEPVSQYDSAINQNLPNIQSNPTASLDVNTFSLLSGVNTNNLGIAYIPSVFAAELLLKKPANPDADLLPSYVAEAVYYQNPHSPDSNFRKNWTAMALPQGVTDKAIAIYRAQGRTPALDASNLREAAIRDLTTIGYVLATNPQYGLSVNDFLKSSMNVYARDKFMCVFEIENIMTTVF